MMNWRDELTDAERAELAQARPGSLVHRLAQLLDEAARAAIPSRQQLSQLDKSNAYIPRNLIRLDEERR
jgi:hypothetical protein